MTPEEVASLGEVKLTPGNPVEAFIQPGNRTMMSYLVLHDQLKWAFRERAASRLALYWRKSAILLTNRDSHPWFGRRRAEGIGCMKRIARWLQLSRDSAGGVHLSCSRSRHCASPTRCRSEELRLRTFDLFQVLPRRANSKCGRSSSSILTKPA